MSGYKVRIADGSEIGPLDLAALRTWLAQGLIDGDSPGLPPGSERWSALVESPELRGLVSQAPIVVGKSKGRKASRAAVVQEDEPEAEEYDQGGSILDDPDKLRVRVAGGILLILAAAIGFLAFRPENATADLDGAPWMEIALGLLVCSLVLLPG